MALRSGRGCSRSSSTSRAGGAARAADSPITDLVADRLFGQSGGPIRRLAPRRASAPVIALVALLVLASVALAVTVGLQGLSIVFVPAPPTPNIPTDALNTRRSLGIRTDL